MQKVINFLSAQKTVERVASGVFVIILALLAFGQVSLNDFWWHLAVGKWMFITKSFLTHEIFSFAFQGKEWMNATWIFDGAIYLIHNIAGFWGLGLFRFVIFAGSYAILIAAARIKYKAPYALAITTFLLTLPSLRNFIRPEITSPLFLGATLYALYNYKYRGSKTIFLLPILEVIWVNTHGSFQMGILLSGIFFGSELIRLLVTHRSNIMVAFKNKTVFVYGLVTGLMALATLINPLGIRIYEFVTIMLNDHETLANVSEWQPFALKNLLNLSSNWLAALVILAWVASVLLIVRSIKLWRQHKAFIPFIEHFFFEDVLIVAFFLISTMHYIRITYLLSVIMAFIIVKNANVFFIKPDNAYFAGLLLLPLAFMGVTHLQASNLKLNTNPSELQHAVESISFLKTNKLQGHMINEYADGGELIWQLYPDYQIFIDGRAANVYDSSFYWYYRNMSNDNVLKALTARYNLEFAIVPIQSGLYQKLSQSESWSLVFFDDVSAIFVLRNGLNQPLIDAGEYTLLNPTKGAKDYIEYCSDKAKKQALLAEISRSIGALSKPTYSLQVLATLLAECPGRSVADLQNAERFAHQVVLYRPFDANLWYTLGAIQISLDKNAEAIASFKQSIDRIASKANLTGIGVALYNTGNYKKAEKFFKQVITTPGDVPSEYYQIYGRLSYQLDHNEQAIDLLHRYINSIDPEKITAQDYLDLSHAYADFGDSVQATNYAEQAKNFRTSTSTPTKQNNNP